MYQTAVFLFIDNVLQQHVLADIPTDQEIESMCKQMSYGYMDPDDAEDIYNVFYQKIELSSERILLDDILLLSIRKQYDWQEEFRRQGLSVKIVEEYSTIVIVSLDYEEDDGLDDI